MSDIPAIQEFGGEVAAILADAEALVHRLQRLAAIRAANTARIDARIVGTLTGDVVPGTTLTRERALAISAMFDSFATWLTTPITVDEAPEPDLVLTPIAIILERAQ